VLNKECDVSCSKETMAAPKRVLTHMASDPKITQSDALITWPRHHITYVYYNLSHMIVITNKIITTTFLSLNF
jgi:hypothetical protein